MGYFVYAKRTKEWWDGTRWQDPDKMFRAIDGKGKRVTKLTDACEFATKEDAQEFLDEKIGKLGLKDGVKVEIRKK